MSEPPCKKPRLLLPLLKRPIPDHLLDLILAHIPTKALAYLVTDYLLTGLLFADDDGVAGRLLEIRPQSLAFQHVTLSTTTHASGPPYQLCTKTSAEVLSRRTGNHHVLFAHVVSWSTITAPDFVIGGKYHRLKVPDLDDNVYYSAELQLIHAHPQFLLFVHNASQRLLLWLESLHRGRHRRPRALMPDELLALPFRVVSSSPRIGAVWCQQQKLIFVLVSRNGTWCFFSPEKLQCVREGTVGRAVQQLRYDPVTDGVALQASELGRKHVWHITSFAKE